MSENLIFVLALALGLGLILIWAFKKLPGEGWQVMASIPISRNGAESWKGINLTYYGLFTANAYTAAVVIFLLLLGSLGVPTEISWIVAGLTLLLCIPASRFIARIVEDKQYVFTVGGSTFIGVTHVPLILLLVNGFIKTSGFQPVSIIPTMAAIVIAYTLGEGIGRLGCISFGCCYGKPLAACPPRIGRLFQSFHFVFSGKTKKIAYASGLDGHPVIPIQAITSTLYVMAALVSILLFLHSQFLMAYFLCLVISQGWRFFSEFFREDYRGRGAISVYQKMALFSLSLGLLLPLVFPQNSAEIAFLPRGIHSIWKPGSLLLLECLWAILFLYTGRSQVTESTLTFHVRKDRI